MPKIKHIALSTQDVEKTAKFYVETFGMKEVGRVNDPGTRGVFLTDGDINLAILNFKNDAAAGIERGQSFSGIHHIGFQVESLAAIAERLTAAGSRRRHDVEHALGVGPNTEGNVEVKWTGPDGVMLDVSQTGWVGTPTFGH
jgi:catechol 2,3-dioxygenase-like lactoylglutathione lyase family enzyme